LIQRFHADHRFAVALTTQCAIRAPRFTPRAEGRRVRDLVAALLGGRAPVTRIRGNRHNGGFHPL
jgi:hypothetical protein